MLFKPKKTSSGSNKWTGVCEMTIVNFTDRSKEFKWADLFLDIEVAIKDSDYTRNIKIRGPFERDDKGTITGGSVLNRMYKFFQDIGCTCGINLQGNWETDDGKTIKDVEKYLNDNHKGAPDKLEYVCYVYKEENRKTKKAYNAVHYRVWPNTSDGNVELASHVKWMKTNGYLLEATPVVTTNVTSDAALAIDDIL